MRQGGRAHGMPARACRAALCCLASTRQWLQCSGSSAVVCSTVVGPVVDHGRPLTVPTNAPISDLGAKSHINGASTSPAKQAQSNQPSLNCPRSSARETLASPSPTQLSARVANHCSGWTRFGAAATSRVLRRAPTVAGESPTGEHRTTYWQAGSLDTCALAPAVRSCTTPRFVV